tara:strand:+ start:295 stop:438 length:144 start_codon:yes stop_codon:yes gene_type:complete
MRFAISPSLIPTDEPQVIMIKVAKAYQNFFDVKIDLIVFKISILYNY